MTQYPNSFLQSESQPWGRSVEQRLADLERQDRLVAQESGNNFAQVNSSTTLLTAQQARIEIQQKLLSASDSAEVASFFLSGNGSLNDLANSPSLSINLVAPARLLVSGSLRASINSGASVSGPAATVAFAWLPNLPGQGICRPIYSETLSGSGVINKILTLSSARLYNAPAGVINITPTEALLQMSGGAGSNITVFDITISATVVLNK